MKLGKLLVYCLVGFVVLSFFGGVMMLFNLGFTLLSLIAMPFVLLFNFLFTTKVGLFLTVLGIAAYFINNRSRSRGYRSVFDHRGY